MIELNGKPVAFSPSFERAAVTPMDAQTRAKVKGLATLIIENG